ncbi:MAG: hypothetical protein Q8R18_04760 [bacterium]|nr:hypothetical protein [bacterium]
MDWKTWTKISAVILFIIAIAGFYLNNFYNEGVELSIQNFPEHLDSLETSEDISFSFYLYNEGDTTAFVESILLVRYEEDGAQVADTVYVIPSRDFTIEPGESKEILVVLPSSEKEKEYSLTAEIFYDNNKLLSNTIPVAWGTLL